ncbi:hypothetical protein [Allostreptomyces psammosilenae]|uniref:Uncharacterized protein n=1 Tax=Allostreptomyces psammosilenae TaxID=1892865 RepID=A0A852ZU78_9ACTN|nr:hypothetical protein [Allostreptomyces psammosilenae]NYI05946.1 hypothetical protein [Allostreptomyces psammosilenae]
MNDPPPITAATAAARPRPRPHGGLLAGLAALLAAPATWGAAWVIALAWYDCRSWGPGERFSLNFAMPLGWALLSCVGTAGALLARRAVRGHRRLVAWPVMLAGLVLALALGVWGLWSLTVDESSVGDSFCAGAVPPWWPAWLPV